MVNYKFYNVKVRKYQTLNIGILTLKHFKIERRLDV